VRLFIIFFIIKILQPIFHNRAHRNVSRLLLSDAEGAV
jgi:hypothetical protein